MKWWMAFLPNNQYQTQSQTSNISVFKKVILTGLAFSLLSGCSILPKEAEEEVIPSIQPPKISKKPMYSVEQTTLEKMINGSGKIMSLKEEVLSFKLDGKRLKEIYVQVGDQVKAGQVLAELDMTDVESQLKQKQLESRKNELQMIDQLRRADELDPNQLEQAKLDFEMKRTEVLDMAESLKNAKIIAPFDGEIVTVSGKEGDFITAYSPIFTISDLSQLTVAVRFDSEDLKSVAVGMKAKVDINSFGSFEGNVMRLPAPNADGNMGSYDSYGNPLPEKPEQFTIIKLDKKMSKDISRETPLGASVVIERKENAIVIPPAALRAHAGRTYAIVVDDKGNKREADVQVGMETATQVEIIRGLQVGQQVVGR